MLNNYTTILKAQRVEHRLPASYAVHGNTVLKARQDVPQRRPSALYRNLTDSKVVRNEAAAPRPAPEWGGEKVLSMENNASIAVAFNDAEQIQRKKMENDAADAVLDGVEQLQTKKLEAPKWRWVKTRHRWEENRETGSDESADIRANETDKAESHVAKIFPRMVMIIASVCTLGFFAYNALLWQSDENQIRPPADKQIRNQMFSFISGNGAAVVQNEVSADIHKELLPINTSETFGWQYYTVRKGDSVSKIASDHSLSMDAVIASNNMKNARTIREGDVLRIPNMDGIPYASVKNDTYEGIAEKFAVPLNAILDANDIMSPELSAGTHLFIPGAKMRSEDLKMALGELFIYPIRGRLSSSFGWRKDPFTGERRYHNAIDLASDIGVQVKATRGGKITTVAFSPVFGRYIIISHEDGYQSMYAHLNAASVSQGAKVNQGDKIGEVGNTGHSTGPHLHFAVYKNGRAVNPLELLKL
ncbi:MAG: M23 family metallopeptidase [Spirochaetaceae bacterium]|jgi:murein DD-endopeptidase MepM/ murein hydrolase activator NlpD|nr:M23 family metallopeptidase [Spirochaetaceae bacterium]